VAVDLRGFSPDNAVPDGAGDPRALTPLIDAINRRGVADKLKIAALDDTPASLTDKKNRAVHHTGGYDPAFDIGDADGTGEGGYKYFWDYNQREFFSRVPSDMLYKVDGRPLIYEWSVNDFAFTNQGNGNLSKLLQYGHAQAQKEFGLDPYYVVDSSWPDRDPSVVSQIDGINNWFTLPTGWSNATYQPVIDNGQLKFGDGWAYQTSNGAGDYRNTYQTTSQAGASVTYSFIGTGVQYLARTASDQGSVDVSIDGQAPVTVQLSTSSALKTQQVVFEKKDLTEGTHTITVTNKAASPVTVDGFRVLTSRPDSLNGRTYGVATPGFRVVNTTTNMVMDPDHGNRLNQTLDATVNGGADITLVEGFTDWEENAMLARTADGTYDERLTDYPNQMIDIMRRYSTDPFPTNLKIEAETADAYSGATPGNDWGVYRGGDIDVQPTGDTGGGWNVGDIAAGESLTWSSEPLQGTVKLSARVATPNDGAQVHFVVDGVAGPTVTVPNTGGWQTYSTVDAGTFQFAAGTHHTVRLEFPTGSLNANYWTATTLSPPATPAPLGPTGQITGQGGKCVDLAGGSAANGTQVVLNTCGTSTTQQWTVAPDKTLRVLGKCLTTQDQGTTNGTHVQIAACDGSKGQQWTVDSANGYLVNAASGLCLENQNGSTADGNPLIVWACNSGDVGQKWAVPSDVSGPSGRVAGYNGKCAEVAGGATADGTAVQLNDCGSGSQQVWTVGSDGTLRALGKCMTVAGGATANGTQVQLSACSGAASQKWSVQSNGELIGTQSGSCLDATGPSSANGTRLQIWSCAVSDNQLWSVPSSRPAGVISGYGGKCAEVAGSLSANGTAIQLNVCGTGSGQSWTVAADGTLRVLGKCMTVAGGATADGTQVQLSTCTGATSQKWTSDSKGQLVGSQSGKCLDATGPSSANGTKLQIWTCAATANQLWKLPT
ncbi:DUF5010 domain-containing protein, partial [Streptomyces broussonetiae]|uniref:DUF5010 domain-containing protein n=1 Tax=Streptomyces broussonetiae TaxID=2686304 RepID=UPI0035D7D3B3